MDGKQRPVLIAGPTASGKSALALAIAERSGGIVINADAIQVYACWRILTARPGAADLARAPHRLYGHVGCGTAYSVGHWLRDAAAAIADAERAGQRPIIVGGTGLYFHALTRGLARIPAIPPELRARSEAMDLDAMRAELDAETAARIDLVNPMRVQRAWEVLAATGRGLADWQRQTEAPVVPETAVVRILLEVEKDLLNRNIERRFRAMLELGALDEVRAFTDWSKPAAQAIGAAELRACIAGEVSLADATGAAVTATRRFAKRQRTWFRSRMRDWQTLTPGEALDLAATI